MLPTCCVPTAKRLTQRRTTASGTRKLVTDELLVSAGPRTRMNWLRAANSDTPPWLSRITIRWPVWCALTSRPSGLAYLVIGAEIVRGCTPVLLYAESQSLRSPLFAHQPRPTCGGKEDCQIHFRDVAEHAAGLMAILLAAKPRTDDLGRSRLIADLSAATWAPPCIEDNDDAGG